MFLGLPCAHCKGYFAADLEVCPICGCNERVVIGKGVAKVVVV
jgi:RNA polymerase subunit RPABC4/transcription elongation factor Spt4